MYTEAITRCFKGPSGTVARQTRPDGTTEVKPMATVHDLIAALNARR